MYVVPVPPTRSVVGCHPTREYVRRYLVMGAPPSELGADHVRPTEVGVSETTARSCGVSGTVLHAACQGQTVALGDAVAGEFLR